MQGRLCDISTVIEQQKFGRFAILLIFYMWFVLLIEGYDIAVLGYAAPALARAWHLSRSAFGMAFSANVPGVLIGSFLFGYFGDRAGRKPAIILGILLFGICTFATQWATGITGLICLRFIAGIGLGGTVPNVIVLLTEFAPRRMRATWISLSYTGYMVGAALGGVVSASLVSTYGWQVVFFVGGVMPSAIAIALVFLMPESIRYLALKKRSPHRIALTVQRIQPNFVLPDSARFIVSDEQTSARFSVKQLFSGPLRYITPVLWLICIANSLTLLFLQNWLPILIEAIGVAPAHAALLAAMFSVGGAAGGLALMRLLDRHGAIVIACLPPPGILLVALLGHTMPAPALAIAIFGVGFCVVGTQFGLNAMISIVYPTAFRSNGTGAALAVSKIGAFLGPMIGGMLMTMHMRIQNVFQLAALPLAFVAVLAVMLGRLHHVEVASPENSLAVEGGQGGKNY
ncbi:MFS transporter [Caballeronia sp. dw_19]|uniref:MFS transporter n=1 Tax=Caballeronia sp. dw_19 TaxID=2719791 RepID=UPI001BD47D00|nr:MFS transporter [Caballeronia sp. dw_19]